MKEDITYKILNRGEQKIKNASFYASPLGGSTPGTRGEGGRFVANNSKEDAYET